MQDRQKAEEVEEEEEIKVMKSFSYLSFPLIILLVRTKKLFLFM